MPSVKDFKDKQDKTETTENTRKRRPGREEPEASDADVKVVDVETGVHAEASVAEDLHEAHTKHEKVEHRHSGSRAAASGGDEPKSGSGSSTNNSDSHKTAGDFEAEPEGPKVEIKFFGSELLRAKAPKPFEIAESVATDWMNNGNFEKLPIEHPLGHFVAQKGLLKAKEFEKKVLESPVTEKVAMQVLTVGMKAQGLFEQVRSRLKK